MLMDALSLSLSADWRTIACHLVSTKGKCSNYNPSKCAKGGSCTCVQVDPTGDAAQQMSMPLCDVGKTPCKPEEGLEFDFQAICKLVKCGECEEQKNGDYKCTGNFRTG